MPIAAIVLLDSVRLCAQTTGQHLAQFDAAARRIEVAVQRFAASTEEHLYQLKVPNDDGLYPPDRLSHVVRIEAWRDGLRFRTMMKATDRKMRQGHAIELPDHNETLVTSLRSLRVPLDPASGRFEGSNLIADQNGDTEQQILRDLHSMGLFQFSGRIDILGPPLSEKVSKAKSNVTTEMIEGRPLARVDFEDEWGEHSVWFDPKYDHFPVRVVQRKLPKHWIRPQVPMEAPPHHRTLGPKTESHTEIVLTGLRRVGGVWFPERSETTDRHQFGKGEVYERKAVHRVLHISWDPFERGNDFTIKTAIPEGARVVIQGQLPLMYEWRDGDIVKNVDPRVEAFLAQQKLQAQSHRWWLWPTVTLAAALAVGLGIWRYRKRTG